MPSSKQITERLDNLKAILKVIRSEERTTRRALMERLSLSWGCVSELVGLLISRGCIVEEKISMPDFRGRAPSALTLSQSKRVLGIDINKLGAAYCVCDFYGKQLFEKKLPLNIEGKQALLSDIFAIVAEARESFPEISVIGFAMQGIRDKSGHTWNFPGKKEISLHIEHDIASRLDLPVIAEHDPRCMLMSCSDAAECESKMLLRIDSGIGATICRSDGFFDGGLLELGYTMTSADGVRLHDVCDTKKLRATNSKEEYLKRCRYIGRHLGTALGNFCNMISLDEIFICGEIADHMDDIYPILAKAYSNTVISEAYSKISVKHIDNAAFGAARLALEEYPYTFRRAAL